MKKILSVFLLVLIFTMPSYAKRKKAEKPLPKDVMAPALQFDVKDYKRYFKNQTVYKVELKTKSQYKITCTDDIIGVNWSDTDNVRMFDEKDINGNIIDIKTVYVKTKNQTITYARLFKDTGEIMNLQIKVSPVFDNKAKVNLGLCDIYPYEEDD